MILPLPENFLACTDCRALLDTLDFCHACGRRYDNISGLPSAFPEQDIDWSVTLPAGFANPARIPRESVFHRPARAGQRASGVYHLDIAHKDLLQAMPKGAVLLETGCGGAQLRAQVLEWGLRYVGTDVSTARVHDWLQEHGGADILCDAHRLPFRDASVDVVYASAVYEHLALPQLAATEAARVLRPGGYFLGSASFLEPWHDESYSHMTPNGIWQVLDAAGLTPQFIWPELDWPGFRAILEMGNRATRPLTMLGRMMNAYYLAPHWLRLVLRERRWPGPGDLFQTRANVAGAIAWIAVRNGTAGGSRPDE